MVGKPYVVQKPSKSCCHLFCKIENILYHIDWKPYAFKNNLNRQSLLYILQTYCVDIIRGTPQWHLSDSNMIYTLFPFAASRQWMSSRQKPFTKTLIITLSWITITTQQTSVNYQYITPMLTPNQRRRGALVCTVPIGGMQAPAWRGGGGAHHSIQMTGGYATYWPSLVNYAVYAGVWDGRPGSISWVPHPAYSAI